MESTIEKIILNASFLKNLGLLDGKMGISILFFNLYRETNNNIYKEYANILIDEVSSEISYSTPIGFIDGLAGIGFRICLVEPFKLGA